jgi:ribosomal protein S18 acetylase RimI-like enzyme
MRDIASQKTFCPEATWLLIYQPEPDWPPADVGTIQGILRPGGVGAVQNVGVVPEHRGQGLGECLLQQAINGFLHCGMDFAGLEVTADNETAVRLYQRMGFTVTEVLYRCGETGKPVKPEDAVYF